MVDQCVRLGMAIVVIGLISVGMHQFSGHASVVEAGVAFTSRP